MNLTFYYILTLKHGRVLRRFSGIVLFALPYSILHLTGRLILDNLRLERDAD